MFDFAYGHPLPEFGPLGIQRRLRSVQIDLTHRCANRCVFCFKDFAKYTATMSMADLNLVLERVAGFSGILSLHAMGDPLVLNDLPEKIQLIRAKCPRAFIQCTSSFNIDRGRAFLEELHNAGLNHIRISCYGFTPEDYQALHGTRNLEHVYQNISHYGKSSVLPDDFLLPVLFREGEEQFGIQDVARKKRDYLYFCKQNRIRQVDLRTLHSWQGQVDAVSPTHRDVGDFRPYPCPVLWTKVAGNVLISPTLDLYPCCLMDTDEAVLGNLRQAEIVEIFDSGPYMDFYQKQWNRDRHCFDSCRHCEYPLDFGEPQEFLRVTAYEALRLAGKEVYFWGLGEAYREYGFLFQNSIPRAFLCDVPGNTVSSIRGIPVSHPDEVLCPDRKLPIVVFAHWKNNTKILGSIRAKYPWYTEKDIILVNPRMMTLDSIVLLDDLVKALASNGSMI